MHRLLRCCFAVWECGLLFVFLIVVVYVALVLSLFVGVYVIWFIK